MADQDSNPTLQEYYDMLVKHDWYFDWSDDGRVWRAGVKARDELKAIAEANGEAYQELLTGFQKYMFTGEPWGTERAPKPERP